MASEQRKVLIAVDGSDDSERAFEWYVSNVYHEGDQLIIFHAHEIHPPALPHAVASAEFKQIIQDHERKIKALEEKYEKKCKDLGAKSKILVVSGSAGEKICDEAKKEHVTLIVIGSRGVGTIRRTILGSVSDYVIHHAHIPVVVCPRPH